MPMQGEDSGGLQYRIRAGAIIVDGDSMLLVQHQDDDSFGGEPWWVTPGGGVEGEESLTECARRETLEETGLSVELGRIAYVAVFVEPGWYHCEVYFVADSYSGTVQRSEAGTGIFDLDHLIKDVRFVPRDEMAGMAVHPEALKTAFWEDRASGFSGTRYLGLRKVE
ncbi:MAG: NUDIX domain-containing protein [Chloroflexi bacterium]|nr:NUDIX domain-containing protein [Chloroflexota bacterium]MYF64520.1 NUDIX domain-containing protein [Chloroflexota bacterium]MYK34359.1 NUDIX domain-containing protein [Chloroflexota bacterium]